MPGEESKRSESDIRLTPLPCFIRLKLYQPLRGLSLFSVRPQASAFRVALWLWVSLVCFLGSGVPALAQSSQAPAGPTTVSGQVINAVSGQPVSRALVRLADRSMLTNYEGRFQFEQVTQDGVLLVTKPGFAMNPDSFSPANVILSKLSGQLTLRLYPEAIITVHVSEPDGDPLQGIFVTSQRYLFDGSRRWTTVGGGLTDTHGDARLPLSAGEYRLVTRYLAPNADREEAILPLVVPEQSSSSTLQSVHLHSGQEMHFDLHPQLSRTYPVDVTVKGAALRSDPAIMVTSSIGARISVSPRKDAVSGVQRIDLPNGSYTLTARTGEQGVVEMAETNVSVANQGLTGVTLNLQPAPTIPIELTIDPASTSDNSASSPPNVNQLGLFLENQQQDFDSGNANATLMTRRDGVSAFTVPFGTYRLRARSAGQWYVKSATYGSSDLLQENLVATSGGGGVPIRLIVSNQAGSVQGTTSLGGKAAAGSIYLISLTPGLTSIISLRSRDDGSFSSTRIPPGSYRALALEQPRQIDFTDPTLAAPFTSWMQNITVGTGVASNLNLDEVPVEDLFP
jgi:hypothetical protein